MVSVAAEYSSALPVGTYKVEAKTIDDTGLESASTAQTIFYVTTQIQKDVTLLFDVRANVPVDVSLLWNVIANGQVDLTLLWNVYKVAGPKDITLVWDTFPVWTNEPFEDDSPASIWTEVVT